MSQITEATMETKYANPVDLRYVLAGLAEIDAMADSALTQHRNLTDTLSEIALILETTRDLITTQLGPAVEAHDEAFPPAEFTFPPIFAYAVVPDTAHMACPCCGAYPDPETGEHPLT